MFLKPAPDNVDFVQNILLTLIKSGLQLEDIISSTEVSEYSSSSGNSGSSVLRHDGILVQKALFLLSVACVSNSLVEAASSCSIRLLSGPVLVYLRTVSREVLDHYAVSSKKQKVNTF